MPTGPGAIVVITGVDATPGPSSCQTDATLAANSLAEPMTSTSTHAGVLILGSGPAGYTAGPLRGTRPT
jgi:hypothetical protein